MTMKKSFLLILTALACMSSKAQTIKAGDVNSDGKVNMTDAVTLIDRCNSGQTKDVPLAVWDVNKDGKVDALDAIDIVKIYLRNGAPQQPQDDVHLENGTDEAPGAKERQGDSAKTAK